MMRGSNPATTGNRHREGVDPIMSDQGRRPERDLQAGAASGAWRRYLQPLIGGALVSLVVLAVNVAVHTLVARTLDIHHEVSLGLVHTSVASAVASVSALVAGMGALAGCVLTGILYMVLDALLDIF